MTRLIGTALLFTAALLAQDNADRTSVPLHDPNRPARIRASLMLGGITVKGADVREVIVESNARGGRRHIRDTHSDRNDGMKRLELPGDSGLEISEDDNVVNIRNSMPRGPTDLVVTVPRHSSLELKTMADGDIDIEQVDGEIDANDLNGKITIKNVSGSVIAHSMNGAISVTIDRIDSGKPMSFSTMNGDIDVTLPPDAKANLGMKTDNGEIYSDFDVKLEGGTRMGSGGRQSDGTFRLRFDRALRGTINGGGPEFQFTSFNGQIYIRKRK